MSANGSTELGSGLGKLSKEEIAARPLFGRKDKLAFVSAVILSSGSLIIHGEKVSVSVSTQNARFAEAVKTVASELTGRECSLTRKNLRYDVVVENALGMLCACRVLSTEGGVSVSEHIPEEFCEEQSAAAYVRGAFLGSGSLSAGRYHLEFSFGRKSIAEDFSALLERFGIVTKIAVRAQRAVVYAKDSESISDCLALMGANKAVLRFNSLIAARQMNGKINRQQNCDFYNIDKQVNTGLSQCAFLREMNFDELTQTLRETAEARIKYPDYSYEQLAEALGISKSGLKNRLRRLREIHDGSKRQG